MTNQMHTTDTLPEHLDAIEAGDMTFASAKAGDYHIGDTVILRGIGRKELYRRITCVLSGGQFGIEPGYVVLGLDKLPLAQAR